MDMKIVQVETSGAILKGGYGHSSVYHEGLGEIFVYGGYVSGESNTQYTLTDNLYSFNPMVRQW